MKWIWCINYSGPIRHTSIFKQWKWHTKVGSHNAVVLDDKQANPMIIFLSLSLTSGEITSGGKWTRYTHRLLARFPLLFFFDSSHTLTIYIFYPFLLLLLHIFINTERGEPFRYVGAHLADINQRFQRQQSPESNYTYTASSSYTPQSKETLVSRCIYAPRASFDSI